MSEKKRLDVLLTERGLQESRQRAQAVIMSGEVFVNGQRVGVDVDFPQDLGLIIETPGFLPSIAG